MLRIGFSGDVSFTGNLSEPTRFGINNFPDVLISELRKNDYNVFNIEGPLTNAMFSPKKGILLKSNPEHIKLLNELKANIFNLANNHIMDCGFEGLKDTINLSRLNSIEILGAGYNLYEASKPVIVSKKGIKVALIAVCHPEGEIANLKKAGIFCDKNENLLKDIIANCRYQFDWVVINYHGGEEYTRFPMPKRRKKLRKYIDWGADIVISHHSHVVQGFECYKNKYIFYSLGNFLFDIKEHKSYSGTNESVFIIFEFSKNNFCFKPYFTKLDIESNNLFLMPDNEFFRELDYKNYKMLWRKDCYRIFFEKSKYIDSNKLHVKKMILNNFLGILVCLKIIRILIMPNYRPVFFAALQYLVIKQLKIVNN